METMEFVAMAVYVLIIAGVAVVVRFYDVPVTDIKASKGVVIKTYIGAIFAVGIAIWALLYEIPDLDIYNPVLFANLMTAAAGGMATFRAVITKLAPDNGI